MQYGSLAAGLRHDCSGMVTADVEESSQDSVVAADHEYRLASDICGDILAGLFDLIYTADELPGFAEDHLAFELGNAGIHVPGSGNG
jgi:hypothetical protein